MDDIFHQPTDFIDDNFPPEPEEAADWEPTPEAERDMDFTDESWVEEVSVQDQKRKTRRSNGRSAYNGGNR